MKPADKDVRVIVAGTKTGGHLYPAEAVGRRLEQLGMSVTLVSSGEAVEDTILRDSGLPVVVLKAGRLKGAGPVARLKGILGLPVGLVRAARLLMKLKPDLVVGFGGYTTGPLLMAAAMMRIPCAICEENSIPGLTNRVLARFARRIFVAYEDTAGIFRGSRV
ncbi:MAG: UDP-N-acetylglucosamine--N-acetylmuramyl-(pentapeptide) pyrophosphoryl-undecaprenol N-acetylglucosamine transferase, partial [Deltaproteobacteria bacterium]|nr:UDP-N-acetylglucosamine--N-acetylmuramyl-(pentapeptide) pyrophosphoryl-undecaprenol N-acetylglucosamine transferase [Deltaproteobacteria bacterium]